MRQFPSATRSGERLLTCPGERPLTCPGELAGGVPWPECRRGVRSAAGPQARLCAAPRGETEWVAAGSIRSHTKATMSILVEAIGNPPWS